MLIGYVREENRKDLKDYEYIQVEDASLDMKMKDIKDYEGIYQVSEYGKVINIKTNKEINPQINIIKDYMQKD